jgi:8-oxo-dGTP diphosphatase
MCAVKTKQVFSTYDRKEGSGPGQFAYCPSCGTKLSRREKGGKKRPTCLTCGFVQFQNPTTGVVVVIEQQGQVLLGRRAGGFGQAKWGLPQGYIEFDEDYLSVVSNFLGPGLHTLAIVLLAGIVAGEPCAADDLDSLEWFPLTGPLPEMAFEADEHIIARYHQMQLEGAPVDPDFACKREQ